MNEGQALHGSPYVEQIEKYAQSLKQLSRTFLGLEEKRQAFSDEEIEGMFMRVRERVCGKCEKCDWRWGMIFWQQWISMETSSTRRRSGS